MPLWANVQRYTEGTWMSSSGLVEIWKSHEVKESRLYWFQGVDFFFSAGFEKPQKWLFLWYSDTIPQPRWGNVEEMCKLQKKCAKCANREDCERQLNLYKIQKHSYSVSIFGKVHVGNFFIQKWLIHRSKNLYWWRNLWGERSLYIPVQIVREVKIQCSNSIANLWSCQMASLPLCHSYQFLLGSSACVLLIHGAPFLP